MTNLNPNMDGLKMIRDPERARELQKKAMKKRRENANERKALKQLLLERISKKDLDEMIDNAITRAKNTDKGFEVYRDTIGEKPTERIEANVDTDVTIKVDIVDE